MLGAKNLMVQLFQRWYSMINLYKKNEISYLKKHCNIFFPSNVTLEQYIEIKRVGLLTFQEKNKLNITNRNIEKDVNIFINPKISFRYSYARFDSYIHYSNFLSDFYYVNNKKYKTKLFFTNSGMSAITSLLIALKQICKGYQFLFPDKDIYFESYDFYNKYIKEKTNKKKNIIYIDTISKLFDSDKYLDFLNVNNDIFAIIIDTTCCTPRDLKIFVSSILERNIFCVLIRSHTKLDMLGAELSSLGSLFYLIPSHINNDDFETIKKIIEESYYILGKFGSLCLPENFPEIIFDKEFRKINEQRLRRIEINNYHLFTYLKNNINKGKVILPNHKKFVLYILDNSSACQVQNEVIEEKIKKLVNHDSELYSACSFGFDYIALDSYYDINEANYVIRISMNDSNPDEIVYNKIKEFINDNF